MEKFKEENRKVSCMLNSNIGKHMFTASIDHSVDGFDSSDNETWMYHQLYDKNGVGYAMQLNTNGNTEM